MHKLIMSIKDPVFSSYHNRIRFIHCDGTPRKNGYGNGHWDGHGDTSIQNMQDTRHDRFFFFFLQPINVICKFVIYISYNLMAYSESVLFFSQPGNSLFSTLEKLSI